jgi:FOG: CBS domain
MTVKGGDMESITVKDYMNKRPVTFSPDMPLSSALEKLLRSQQTGGPVVDANKRLVGFISEQDMLQQLLRDSYHCKIHTPWRIV